MVPANLLLGGNPAMDLYSIQGGVEILLVDSCYRNRKKLRPDEPLGLSHADFELWPGTLCCVLGQDTILSL